MLSNPDDDDSVIPLITREIFKMYEKNGIISGGMKPKVENALSAVESGVNRVVITLADNIGKANEGTVIQ